MAAISSREKSGNWSVLSELPLSRTKPRRRALAHALLAALAPTGAARLVSEAGAEYSLRLIQLLLRKGELGGVLIGVDADRPFQLSIRRLGFHS